MAHESGEQLLHYRLVEKIGQGGMGSVWRADDMTLDRQAAIKILPAALANDEQFLARFEQEAKLLASLDHPNVATVFGVHESDGTRFMAMELLPGEDLSKRLERDAFTPSDAVRVLSQIADALEAAHAKGVVHRDLKPANIRLVPDGRVKVLDFGLARAVGVAAAGPDSAPLTSTGMVLGTAPYMSPEQARGERVDPRTDLWSFGCVAWECLTGRRPFGGENMVEQLSAVLNEEPDWSSLPAETPDSLMRLLRRCLAKPLQDRLHHAADARLELADARREIGRGAAPAHATLPAKRRTPLVRVAVVVVALALISAMILQLDAASPPRRAALHNARFRKLTNFPGDELGAAISPDGDVVAFLADLGGPFEAYVGTIDEEYRNVSESSGVGPVLWPMIRVRRIGFFGDGKALWLGGGPNHKATRVPLVGAGVAPWLQEGVIHMDWSRDGRRIVYSHSTRGDPIFIANADGTEEQEVPLTTAAEYHQHFPTWSMDGEWLYVCRGIVRSDRMDLWRVRPDGTGLKRLTKGLRNVMYPAPVDERTVLFIANGKDGTGPWLWELDTETLETRHKHRGVARYSSISASRDGRRLVATVIDPTASLWTVPILRDREATEDDVKPHPLPAVRAHAPRLRGDALYYLSSHGGDDGLWVYSDGASREIWKGTRAPLAEPAAIAPDGERVAINVRENGRGRLYVIRADGTDPRKLMADVDIMGAACWSPNGEWIAVGGEQDGRRGLFKVRVQNGEVVPLDSVGGMNPVWAPDDSMIVFEGPHVRVGCEVIAITPQGRRIESFPKIQVRPFAERLQFLPDGSGLVYLMGVNPHLEFHLLHFESGKSQKITDLADHVMHTFDITRDGQTIVFDRERLNADVVLIERAVDK